MGRGPGSREDGKLPAPSCFHLPGIPLTVSLFLDLGVDPVHGGLQVVPAQDGPSQRPAQLHQTIKVTGSRGGRGEPHGRCQPGVRALPGTARPPSQAPASLSTLEVALSKPLCCLLRDAHTPEPPPLGLHTPILSSWLETPEPK